MSTRTRSIGPKLRPGALALALGSALGWWVAAQAVAASPAPTPAGAAGAPSAGPVGVLGKVLYDADALASARVYAYQLADLSLRRVTTDADGAFDFGQLPAGLYRLIAHKAGFLPVAVLLTRTSAEAFQFVEVHLARAGAEGEADDFWKLRGHLPADVLREIEGESQAGLSLTPPAPAARGGVPLLTEAVSGAAFTASMSAMAGRRAGPYSSADVREGALNLRSLVGKYSVGVDGAFTSLEAEGISWHRRAVADAQLNAISVQVAGEDNGSLRISGNSNQMTLLRNGRNFPVSLEHYDIAWSGSAGGEGHSTVRAEYIDESSFFGRGWVVSSDLPDASQTFNLEGSYARNLGDRHSIEAGVRFRQRESVFSLGAGRSVTAPYERIDLFSRGGFQAAPSMVVEYGLYTTLRDGSVSLTPRGGFVLQMGPRWQAATSVAYRVEGEPAVDPAADFLPVQASDRTDFTEASSAEYRVALTRSLGEDDESMTLAASHRVFSDSLRLYFSDQFFDYLQNLYLVPGDSLPEVQFSISRRLGDDLHARLESSYARGGGGTVTATDRRQFENEVQYFVTSVDTLYRPTSTGLFLSFHRIEQSLGESPGVLRARRTGGPMELETLEVAVRQELNVLLELAARWAVRLDAEFTRGDVAIGLPDSDAGVRRRFLGGLAVRF